MNPENPFSKNANAYQRVRGIQRHKETILKSQKKFTAIEGETGGSLAEEIESLLKNADLLPESTEKSEVSDDLLQELDTEIAKVREGMTDDQMKKQESLAYSQLLAFMRKRNTLQKTRTKVDEKIDNLIRAVHADKNLREQTGSWERISAYEDAVEGIDGKILDEAKENPVAYQAHWLLQIREWKRMYEENGLIETEAIKEQTRKVMDDARRKLEGTNGVVTLLGPTGSGKSVLAKKIGDHFSPNGEYEFVSAHPKMTAFDLIQRMGIVVEQLDPVEIPRKIKEAQKRYTAENPDTTGEEMDRELETIADVITGRAKEKTFETKPILEAIGRAQKEGRIVVIDEFNYLPPETLAALNDILSNKDNPSGFGVVLTGNVGEEYLKRQALDPAFINRVLSGTVQYEFPPQEIDAPLDGSIKSTDALQSGENTADRDLYQIAMTQLVDTKGNLLAPKDSLRQVWDFVRICSLAQKMAQGKDFRSLGLSAPVGVSAMQFKSVFLSFRSINQVVREWKLGGYRQPLDWHIYDTIIRPASIYAPKEAAELVYLFRDWGGFLQGDSWDPIEVEPTQWRIAGLDGVKKPKSVTAKLTAFSPAELVEAVSGYRLPEVSETEEAIDRQEQKEYEMAMAEFERVAVELEKELNDFPFETLQRLCEVRANEGMAEKAQA
ncbi:MAG: AAA family ATPase [bacterium]|nr:AAA family ATPase [bacterium]